MKSFRLIFRTLLLVLWFLVITILTLFIHAFNLLVIRKQSFLDSLITPLTKIWIKGILIIMGVKLDVQGDLKGKSGILMSNHVSYIDILALGGLFELKYTPKSDIRKWPFLGWFINLSNPIWIDRSSRQASKKSLEHFSDVVNSGINVAVFPEGTTTDGKGELLPFKSTFFEVSVQGKLLICPILVKYEEENGIPIAWYGDMTLLPHLKDIMQKKKTQAYIKILEPVEPGELNRKELAAKLHNYMNNEYIKFSKEI